MNRLDAPSSEYRAAEMRIAQGRGTPKDYETIASRKYIEGQVSSRNGQIDHGPDSPEVAAARQQLLAMEGVYPDRNYSAQVVGAASPEQVLSEVATLPVRENRRRMAEADAMKSDAQRELDSRTNDIASMQGRLDVLNQKIQDTMVVPDRERLIQERMTQLAVLPEYKGVSSDIIRAQAEDDAGNEIANITRQNEMFRNDLIKQASQLQSQIARSDTIAQSIVNHYGIVPRRQQVQPAQPQVANLPANAGDVLQPNQPQPTAPKGTGAFLDSLTQQPRQAATPTTPPPPSPATPFLDNTVTVFSPIPGAHNAQATQVQPGQATQGLIRRTDGGLSFAPEVGNVNDISWMPQGSAGYTRPDGSYALRYANGTVRTFANQDEAKQIIGDRTVSYAGLDANPFAVDASQPPAQPQRSTSYAGMDVSPSVRRRTADYPYGGTLGERMRADLSPVLDVFDPHSWGDTDIGRRINKR